MILARNHFGEIQNCNASFLSVLRNVVWIGPSPKEWLFWPLLYLPVCPNPISCQSYFKIDMLPGAITANSTSYLLPSQYSKDSLWERQISLPSVAISLPLWSPWLSLSLCWIWLYFWITCLGFGCRASEINTISLTS